MNTLDRDGRSELHYAARDGDLARVQKLVAAGYNVNLKDGAGWTPLHFAAQARSELVTKCLLNHGALVDSQDAYGNTPLFRATFASRGEGEVILALRAAGADPKMKNKSNVSPVGLSRKIANYNVAQHYKDIGEL